MQTDAVSAEEPLIDPLVYGLEFGLTRAEAAALARLLKGDFVTEEEGLSCPTSMRFLTVKKRAVREQRESIW